MSLLIIEGGHFILENPLLNNFSFRKIKMTQDLTYAVPRNGYFIPILQKREKCMRSEDESPILVY